MGNCPSKLIPHIADTHQHLCLGEKIWRTNFNIKHIIIISRKMTAFYLTLCWLKNTHTHTKPWPVSFRISDVLFFGWTLFFCFLQTYRQIGLWHDTLPLYACWQSLLREQSTGKVIWIPWNYSSVCFPPPILCLVQYVAPFFSLQQSVRMKGD